MTFEILSTSCDTFFLFLQCLFDGDDACSHLEAEIQHVLSARHSLLRRFSPSDIPSYPISKNSGNETRRVSVLSEKYITLNTTAYSPLETLTCRPISLW